ncbi:MAG: cation:proton antiporter [Sphaerobacteraceae bacterium]|nr:MAG: cation:proton antiporter [Sphaerobacteraceae bacterium]
MEITVNVMMIVLTVALLMAFFRLVKGPTLPDRVVALDLVAAIAVAIFAVYAVVVDQPVFIDAAIVLALIIFLGTVAFARYTERRGRP